jgi:prepilin-type N-terminal cleavage/methylation domain-containing protein
MSSRRPNFSKAFTLIELVLVLVLIASIVTIAIPSLSRFGKSRRVGDSADRVIALAHWARTQAITRGVNFRLNFDPTQRTYWLTMQNGASFENLLQNGASGPMGGQDGTSQNGTTFAEVGDEVGRVFVTPQGVTFQCNFQPQPDGTYLQFRPTGRSDPGTVTFTDGEGQPIEVGALMATEPFHVLNDQEKQLEQNMPVPPPPAQSR